MPYTSHHRPRRRPNLRSYHLTRGYPPFKKPAPPLQALLLIYASLERYIDLCLWTDFRLDDEKPDYSSIVEKLKQETLSNRYDDAGRKLFGEHYKRREPEGPLMFGNGAQILTALAPNRLPPECLKILRGISSSRNKTEFEHGFLPRSPQPNRVSGFLIDAEKIIASGCGSAIDLRRAIEDSKFPKLPDETANSAPEA